MKTRFVIVLVLVASLALLGLSSFALAQSSDPLVDDVITIVTAAAEGRNLKPLLEELTRKYAPVTPTPVKVATENVTPVSTGCKLDAELMDVAVSDERRFSPDEMFAKVWYIENTGTCTWEAGYEWALKNGPDFGSGSAVQVPIIGPGEKVELRTKMAAPSLPGSYNAEWQMRSPAGKFFGAVGTVRFEVLASTPHASATALAGSPVSTQTPPKTSTPVSTPTRTVPLTKAPPTSPTGVVSKCTNAAEFIEDVTVPDNTQFDPGDAFTKVWRIKNTGSCPWGTGYRWVFVSGDMLGAEKAIEVPSTAPGETVDLEVSMKAPNRNGTFLSTWQMQSPAGELFDSTTYVLIQVGELPTTTPTATTIPVVSAAMYEPVTVGDWLLYAYKIHRQARVWYYETPYDAENGMYAIVRLKVNNLTMSVAKMSDQLQFSVHDEQGRVFDALNGKTPDRAAHRHVPNHANVSFKMPPGVIDYPVLLTFDVPADSQELWLDITDRDGAEKASIYLSPCQSDEERDCQGKFVEALPKD